MTFLSRLLSINPARELALHGAAQRRRYVIDTARRMRAELGLPAHPALDALSSWIARVYLPESVAA